MATQSKLGAALQGYANNAPEAGFGPNVNFGRLTATPMVKRFKGKGEAPEVFPLKDGYTLGQKEFMVLRIHIDITEFNPNLTFEYERDVDIRKSSGSTKSDWQEIVLPSIEKVFGSNWADEILKSAYVECADVPNVNGNTAKSGRVLTVPQFVAKFKNKAECATAREARFGKSDEGGANASAASDVPDNVLRQVKSLLDSAGEETTRELLAKKTFGDYDPDVLIEKAQAL